MYPHIHGNLLAINIVICSWTVHERSWNVREQAVIREQDDLDNEIRKLSNKQTNKHCSWTVREQLDEQQTLYFLWIS